MSGRRGEIHHWAAPRNIGRTGRTGRTTGRTTGRALFELIFLKSLGHTPLTGRGQTK